MFLPIQHRYTIVKELSITLDQTVISESLMYLNSLYERKKQQSQLSLHLVVKTEVIVFLQSNIVIKL